MKSCTAVNHKYPVTELEDYPALCSVVTTLWDHTKVTNKYSMWFCLHGAAVTAFDENERLAAELVFLRELWATAHDFGI